MLDLPRYDSYFDLELKNTPYVHGREYMEDCLYLVDMLVELALYQRNTTCEQPLYLRGVSITHKEIESSLLASRLDNRTRQDSAEQRKQLAAAYDHIKLRAALSAENSVTLPLHKLFMSYDMRPLERLAVVMAYAAERRVEYGRYFGYLQDSLSKYLPELPLVCGLYESSFEGSISESIDLRSKSSKLRRQVFSPCDEPKALKLSERIVLWLDGDTQLSPELLGVAELLIEKDIFNYPIITNENKFSSLLYLANNSLYYSEVPGTLVRLIGYAGSGRRFFMSHLASELNCPVIIVDLPKLCRLSETQQERLCSQLLLENRLTGALVFLHGEPASEYADNVNDVLYRLVMELPLLFISVVPEQSIPEYRNIKSVEIKLDCELVSQRQKLWSAFASEYKLSEDVGLSKIANQYKLTPGAIKRALEDAAITCNLMRDEDISEGALVNAIHKQSACGLSNLAVRLSPTFTWDDLVLEDEQKSLLRQICNRLKYRYVVGEKWGFDKKVIYGRGISAVFYGPPGTGKTMSAQVIANETGLELYRIDLSQISSKYVGETEKNIAKVFEEARSTNAILFFDEADALFSKRTEVKNANDRFANAETSYILQSIEEYDGMAILSTNLYTNFDSAFARRITYAVDFKLPDAAQRLSLWKSILPSQAPVSQDLDIEYLAGQLELTGSSIKSVLHSAAFIAAADNQPIGMKQIVSALKQDYLKNGKMLLPTTLGKYAYLL